MNCPLCDSVDVKKTCSFKVSKKIRDYYLCNFCDLVFVPSCFHLNLEQEKKQYDFHQNHQENKGYVEFLRPVADIIKSQISKESNILDFGCGPGPVLSEILQDEGYKVELYDPYFYPEQEALKKKYQVVVSTEVVEHFCNPKESWEQLFSLLVDGGRLLVKTQMRDEIDSFTDWHYHRDITHVAFYSQKCMSWIAEKHDVRIEVIEKDLVVFFKTSK